MTAIELEDGFQIIPGLETELKATNVRDTKFFKIDLLKSLNRFFEDKTLKDEREEIYSLVSGVYESVSEKAECIRKLCNADKQFSTYFYMVYKRDLDVSIGDKIIKDLRDKVLESAYLLCESFKGNSKFFITESLGYLYFSSKDFSLTEWENYKCEEI